MSTLFRILPGALALGLLQLTAGTAQALDAKTVLTKTDAVYKNMKSMQATFETTMASPVQGSMTMQTSVKMIRGKKANVIVEAVGKGSGAMGAQQANAGVVRIVDNGVTAYVYQSKKNQYVKQPHANVNYQRFTTGYGLPGGDVSTAKDYKLLAPSSLDGQKVYVLEFKPAEAKGAVTIDIFIDQATYHIKQSKIMQTFPDKTTGKPTVGTITTRIKNESLNIPIADSNFTFTPPKGATEFVPPPQTQAPGGLSGQPQGR